MPILRGNIWIWLNALWFLTGIYILQWRAEAILFGYLIEAVIIGGIVVFQMSIIGSIKKEKKEKYERIQEHLKCLFEITVL